MAFDIYWFNHYISLQPGKLASGQEIIETMQLICNDERYKPYLHQVWDFSKTERLTLKSTDLQTISSLNQHKYLLNSSAYLAIIAPKPAVFYRMQAIVSYAKAQFRNSKVFENSVSAHHWLGINA